MTLWNLIYTGPVWSRGGGGGCAWTSMGPCQPKWPYDPMKAPSKAGEKVERWNPLGPKVTIKTAIYLQLTNSSQITKNAGLFLLKFQWPRKKSQACLTFLVLSISSVTSKVLSYTFIIPIPKKENISFYGFYKQKRNVLDCWWCSSGFIGVITAQYSALPVTPAITGAFHMSQKLLG